MMVVGFDVHHPGFQTKGGESAWRGGESVGAMVATTSGSMTSYFSTVSFHHSGDELARNMRMDLTSKIVFFSCMQM
jgi:hypothetical protein